MLLSFNIFFCDRSPGSAYVEGDASSASYFLAGAAITGGTVTVEGCGTTSLQVNLDSQNFLIFKHIGCALCCFLSSFIFPLNVG